MAASQPAVNPQSTAALTKGARQRTRKVLEQKLKEANERLKAAGGETRKNLRDRIARITAENAELKAKQIELEGKLEAAKKDHERIQQLTSFIVENDLKVPD